MKACSKCKQTLPKSEFSSNKSTRDGLCSSCKECEKNRARLFRANNRYEISNSGNKECTLCKKTLPISNFGIDIHKFLGRNSVCRGCRKYKKDVKKISWADRLISKKRKMLKMQNSVRDFDITAQEVLRLYDAQAGKCYWFGIPLLIDGPPQDPQKPSLDRIDNTQGYVKGNVVLACISANLGRNSTTPERFKQFVELLKNGQVSRDDEKRFTDVPLVHADGNYGTNK